MKILTPNIDIANLHGNTLLDIECDCCRSRFSRMAKIVDITLKRGSRSLFCSPKCASLFRKTAQRINLTCPVCGINFHKTPSDLCKSGNSFCSRACYHKNRSLVAKRKSETKRTDVKTLKIKNLELPQEFPCGNCGKKLFRTRCAIAKSKSGLFFCSKSCRMVHFNLNAKRTYPKRKSYAETFLASIIRESFPLLTVRENDRTVLDSRLELDIWMPEKRLAIELNGPFHYFPIFGQDRLDRVQKRDESRLIELRQKNIGFMTLDISMLQTKKKTEAFLTEIFETKIRPILETGAEVESAISRI